MDEGNPLKMKVTELKAELGKRGLSQTGLKFDLAQRLQTAMDVDEFGALSSLTSPSQPLLCASQPSNPVDRRAPAFMHACLGGAISPAPIATIRESFNHEGSLGRGSLLASTCSPATKEQPDNVATRVESKDTEGETPTEHLDHLESRSSPLHTLENKHPAPPVTEDSQIQGNTPMRPDEKSGVDEYTINGAARGERVQAPLGSSWEGSAEHESEAGEEGYAKAEQLEIGNSFGADGQQATNRDSEEKNVEKNTTNATNIEEMPSTTETSDRGSVSSSSCPRNCCENDTGGKGRIGQEPNKVATAKGGRSCESSDNEEKQAAVESTDGPAARAKLDTPTESLQTAVVPDGTRGEPLTICRKTDRVKDRDDDDAFDEEGKTGDHGHIEASRDRRRSDCLREESLGGESAGTPGALTIEDVCRAKLIKRKARFGAPPSDGLGKSVASRAASEGAAEAATRAAAKMARRAERFATAAGGSSATASTETRDPLGSFFGQGKSSKGVAVPDHQSGLAVPGGGPFDPLPQRTKRARARPAPSEPRETPGKRRRKDEASTTNTEFEGRETLVSALVKATPPAVTPGKTSNVTHRDTAAEKRAERRVRFQPAACAVDGVEPLRGGESLSPLPRAAPVSSIPLYCGPSLYTRSVSYYFERFGVVSGPSTAEPDKGGVPCLKGRGEADKKDEEQAAAKMRERRSEAGKKAEEQAAKMRERRIRFAAGLQAPR